MVNIYSLFSPTPETINIGAIMVNIYSLFSPTPETINIGAIMVNIKKEQQIFGKISFYIFLETQLLTHSLPHRQRNE